MLKADRKITSDDMMCCINNPYSVEDISQADSNKPKKVSESQPSIEPPVTKKRKIKAVNSQRTVDDTQNLFNQPSNDGTVKLTTATQMTESTNHSDKLPTDKLTINENTTTSTANAEDIADSIST